MNTRKILLVAGLALGSLFVNSMSAQTSDPVDTATTAAVGKVDKVGEYGAKAVTVAAGLALAFTVIAFIRKAKR